MKESKHIKGTDIYTCVHFGAAWLKLRTLLVLGVGLCSTVCRSFTCLYLNVFELDCWLDKISNDNFIVSSEESGFLTVEKTYCIFLPINTSWNSSVI